MRLVSSGRSRDYLGGILMVALGLGVALQGATYPLGSLRTMGPGFFPTALGVLLALTGVGIAVAARLTPRGGQALEVRRPEWRAWLCLAGSIVAFVVVGTYGGLAPATFAIVFIAALADRENSWTSALAVALLCVLVCVVVFWWGLKLQFPLFQWGAG